MSDKKGKLTFTIETETDGGKKTTEYAVLRPNHRVTQQAQLVYSRAVIEGVNNKLPLQKRVEKLVEAQGLWGDEQRTKLEELVKKLLEGEKVLAQGARSGKTMLGCKTIAVEMRRIRHEVRQLTSEQNALYAATAEAWAEQRKFDFLVASCTVYGDTGEKCFKDTEDYLARAEADDPIATQAAISMSKIEYNLEAQDAHLKSLPENKFLLRCGFVNEALHLIDPQTKHLVNADGKFVNEKGQLVNEKDEPIDEEGNVLNDDGTFKVEFMDWDSAASVTQ